MRSRSCLALVLSLDVGIILTATSGTHGLLSPPPLPLSLSSSCDLTYLHSSNSLGSEVVPASRIHIGKCYTGQAQ